jgi:translation initiation factor 1
MSDKIVWSTEPGFRQPAPVRLSFHRLGKGSGMTRVEGLIMHPIEKEQLFSQLKKRLGCGGAIKDGRIEIQGDRRDFIEAELVKQGYKVKRVGG